MLFPHLFQDADVTDALSDNAFVGPPFASYLIINHNDLEGKQLKVDQIIREGQRWKHIRSLLNARGRGLDKLLRVVGARLEELDIVDKVGPTVMAEVEKMKSLKRLSVDLDIAEEGYPDLPLQLEELSLDNPQSNQMLCVQRMPKLRSLRVYDYLEPNMTFPPSPYGALLWLDLDLLVDLLVSPGIARNRPGRQPLTEAQVTDVVDIVLRGVAP